jgi:Serine aminopeptidase, S33
MPVRERALLFGEGKSLVGIVSDAADATSPPTGALLLNAGVLHRVGPNRLHVRLARTLAESGVVAMRFDFSGLGDSRPARDALPFAERVIREIRAATEALHALRGCRRFLLMGICSGADAALRAASRDERVVGAALIEPYAEPRPGFLAYSYRRKLLSPRAWLRLAGGRSELWSRWRGPAAPAVSGAPPAPAPLAVATPDDSLLPSPPEMRAHVRQLLERGVHLCFVYSVDSPAYFNYRTLLGREVGPALRSKRARLEVLRGTDHIFTPLAVQERLVEAVAGWARGVTSEGA